MTIYYVYRKNNGDFAGSGITEYDDAEYGSTTTAPATPSQVTVTRFDITSQTWQTFLAPADEGEGSWLDNLPMTGDIVAFDGIEYRSLIDNNVWTPEAYPQGWEPVNPSAAGAWVPNISVTTGEQYTYEGTTYEVLQPHQTQLGWEPPNVPALWSPV